MLEEITPSQPEDANDTDDVEEHDGAHEANHPERPQFVLGEEVAPHDAPMSQTAPVARTSTEGKRSVEGGGGWKQVV